MMQPWLSMTPMEVPWVKATAFFTASLLVPAMKEGFRWPCSRRGAWAMVWGPTTTTASDGVLMSAPWPELYSVLNFFAIRLATVLCDLVSIKI